MQVNEEVITQLTTEQVHGIAEYFASEKDVKLLLDLPIFVNAGGHSVKLDLHSKQIFATDEELALFGATDRKLIPLDSLQPAVQHALFSMPNFVAHKLSPVDLPRILTTLLGHLKQVSATVEAEQETLDWLLRFWTWVDKWPLAKSLETLTVSKGMNDLHLIPLQTSGTEVRLRRLGRPVLDGHTLDTITRKAIASLGIPVLHPRMICNPTSRLFNLKDPTSLDFILDALPASVPYTSLDSEQKRALKTYVEAGLVSLSRHGQTLSLLEKEDMPRLPIYPILPAGARLRRSEVTGINLQAIHTLNPIFVDDSIKFVPPIASTIFIDGTDSAVLAAALGEETIGEVEVLTLALKTYSQGDQTLQQTGLVDGLVDRVFRRITEFDAESRNLILTLPVVDVGEHRPRAPPALVVDPQSRISQFFDGDDGVLPCGRFADEAAGAPLQLLRSFGMLRSSITDDLVVEILERLSGKPDETAGRLTLDFLSLLDEYTKTSMLRPTSQYTLQNLSWLPAGGVMRPCTECWDSRRRDQDLVDLVVPRVMMVIKSPHLRHVLGWQRVPMDILRKQLIAAASAGDSQAEDSNSSTGPAYRRIVPLLKELASRLSSGECDRDQIRKIAQAVETLPWVPVAADRYCRPRQAILSRIQLGTRFRNVSEQLIVGHEREVLRAMGVCDL